MLYFFDRKSQLFLAYSLKKPLITDDLFFLEKIAYLNFVVFHNLFDPTKVENLYTKLSKT